jgi:hypothetical protein
VAQNIQPRIRLQSKRDTLTRKRSLYLQFVFSMVIGFTAVNTITRALARYTTPPANPFSAFADIFPGQLESAIDLQIMFRRAGLRPAPTEIPELFLNIYSETRARSCQRVHTSPYTPQESCTFTPAEGVFSSIYITFSRGIIRQTTFTLRHNTFRVGDLALFLGTRNFRTVPHILFFSWHGYSGVASTVGGAGQFSLFDSVWMVTFTDTPPW